MSLIDVILTAIVEGITEFLPISSTGHMILLNHLLGDGDDYFSRTFIVFIQLGAILAIVLLYARRFLFNIGVYFRLFVAFLPSAIVGFLLFDFIKTHLFNPMVVAWALIIGGVILIILDKRLPQRDPEADELSDMTYRRAFFIGLFQCLSVIPGVSRAAATMIGGMTKGLSKKGAAEFSFLLAIPTMAAATGYDLLKFEGHLSFLQWEYLGIGFVVAFLTALLVVKWFVHLLDKHGFSIFGYYRIVVGVIFILFAKNW
ncbi:MAG: undecaprenyl-diphosphate phosphatase [Saprospirales bacterium]|nr:undecaprenyl-diphosphate phosphatase [Saprospirales bacterium]